MGGGECKEAGKGSLARKVKRGGVRGGEQLLTSVRPGRSPRPLVSAGCNAVDHLRECSS